MALVPSVAQHHVFNDKVMTVIRERTERLLALVDTLRGDAVPRTDGGR
jgi:hypothetical protein